MSFLEAYFSPRARWAFLALLLVLVTVVHFWPSTGFEFLNWDDPELFTEHPWFHPLTWTHLVQMWDPRSLRNDIALDYSPIRDLSYAVDLWIWGWSSFGTHLTQVLLHALNALLVFLLFQRRVNVFLSFAGALLWAFHPLVVEPVAWISGRKDLLMAFFLLGCLNLWDRKHEWGAVSSGLLSMLCKYTSVFLAPLIWCFARLRNEAVSRRTVIILGVFGLALSLFVLEANAHRERLVSLDSAASLCTGFLGIFQIATHNFVKIFWPFNLSARYAQTLPVGLLVPALWSGLLVIIGWIALTVWAFRRHRVLAEGLLVLGIFTLPTFAQAVVSHPIWMADRYQYLPLVGVVWALVGLPRLNHARLRKVHIGVVLILALLLSVLSHERLFVWRNSLTLWTDTAAKTPSLYYVWGNLGQAYLNSGKNEAALKSFQKSLKLHPSWYRGYLFLAQASQRMGDSNAAHRAYSHFEAKAPPREKETYRLDRALLSAELGFMDVSEKLFLEHLKEQPGSAAAWTNLGVLYAQTRREERALKAWSRALQIRPYFPAARLNRARYWFLQNRCEKVLEDLTHIRNASPLEIQEGKDLRALCTIKESPRHLL